MKRNNRKGFTTVELVIVIAVIAILATALIPTFGGLIDGANKTAAMQEARQVYNDWLLNNVESAADLHIMAGKTNDEWYYPVVDGKLNTNGATQKNPGGTIIKKANDGNGYTCVGSHIPGTTFYKDATNHWNVCTVCEDEVEKAPHSTEGQCTCGHTTTPNT